ncbi:MAG: twin-arginine translocation signal domain-containing protein, partial [Sutterella wadsworthensis]|nr:twin-arginine translocation signal domain-containing protein [Sutterella wadsworthensis]
MSVIGLSLKKWRKTMSKQVLLDRRDFLRGGASVAMAAVLGSSETLAAEAGEKPKIRPLEGKMDYESI